MTNSRKFLECLSIWTLFAVALASMPDPASAQNRAYRIDVVPQTATALNGSEELGLGAVGHVNINELGEVLFDAGGSLGTGLALWAGEDLTILARNGLNAPGTGGDVFGPHRFYFSRIGDNGDVAFVSSIGLDDYSFIDHGLWAGQPGQLELIARTGDPAPGAPGQVFLRFSILRDDLAVAGASNSSQDPVISGIHGPAVNGFGDLVFRAAIGDPSACIPDCSQQQTPPLQEGLWRHSANGLELIALGSDSAPGLNGVNFTDFPFYVLNDAGDVTLAAMTDPLPYYEGLAGGIWTGQAGSLRPVAVAGQIAPGTGGSTFSGFHIDVLDSPVTASFFGHPYPPGPVTNNAGDIGFFALSQGGEGIWVEQGGELRLLARQGDPAPGAADATFYIMYYSNLQLNEAGQFAFNADLIRPDGLATGIWIGDPDALNLVVSTGDEAPGFEPTPFVGFDDLDVNLSGDVAFEGATSGSDWTYGRLTQGVWVAGSDGVSSVLQDGWGIEVAPGEFRKTDNVFLSSTLMSENGETRAINDAGQISLFAFNSSLLIATPIDPAAPNEPPIAEAGPDLSVPESDFFTLDAAGTADAEGTPLFFSWSEGGVLLGTGPQLGLRATMAQGPHTVTLTVTDQQGLSDTDTMTLTVEPPNARPVADAGPDQTVNHFESIVLDGTASSDPDGDTLTYSWRLMFDEVATTAIAEVGPFDISILSFVLRVTDPYGHSSSDNVIITITQAAPVADAGQDQTVSLAQGVLLDGTGSSDLDGDTLTYSWELDGAVVASTAAAAVGPLAVSPQTFTLTVTDPAGASSSDSVVIATTTAAPVADAGLNQTLGTGGIFSLDGSASFDPQGGALTYAWFLDGTRIGTEATATAGPLAPGLHVAALRVTDLAGVSATDTVVLAVTTPGQEPVDIAGAIRVPDDHATIQSAIDAAVEGDTILVSPGFYVETLNFQGKAVTSISEFGPTLTFIDGSVTFASGEGLNSVLQGFTVRDGAGIVISSASPKVIGNRILENSKCDGGGVQIAFGSPVIQDNVISGNRTTCTWGKGGGISFVGTGSPQILDNVISDNFSNGHGGGISLSGAGTQTIRGNRIERNLASRSGTVSLGGGIHLTHLPEPLIVQNVIVDNTADSVGGIYWSISSSGGRGPQLVNNTIADNSGTQIAALGRSAQALLINNNISGADFGTSISCGQGSFDEPPMLLSNNAYSTTDPAYSGNCAGALGVDGNISSDPLFVDAANGDYRLQGISPLVDAGDNLAPDLLRMDPDGKPRIIDGDGDAIALIDIGAFEFGIGPVANAGPDQEVTDLDLVTLDGTESSDPAGGALAYAWSLNGAALATGPAPVVGPLPLGTHAVILTVTDSNGAATADVTILTVVPSNHPPVANAGLNQTVSHTQGALLDGTGSTDPNGDTLTYSWELDGAVIASTATAAVGPFPVGAKTFTLTVSDPDGASSSDTVVITTTNATPVANAGPDQTLPALATTSHDGSGSSDPDGEAITYQWMLGGAEIATGPTPTVGPFSEGLHTITLTVTDTLGASSTDTVVMTVTNTAPVADAGPDATIQDLDTVTLDGSGSSDPEGGALTYEWRLGGTVIGTGVAPSVGPFPVGAQTITLTVTDSEDATASDSLTVTVEDPPPPPDTLVQLPLDEGSGTTAVDISGFNNDGTLVNGPTYDAATADGSAFSVRFDGSNDFIDLGVLDVTGSGLTLAARFNADRFPGRYRDPRLISKASSTRSSRHVFMLGTIRVGSATRLRARVRVGGSTKTLVASSGNLQTGQWHHAAVTHDGGTLRLYLDGAQVGSRSLNGTVDVDPTLSVAVGAQPPGAGGKYFDGLIDDVRILSRAMSAAEVSQIGSGGS